MQQSRGYIRESSDRSRYGICEDDVTVFSGGSGTESTGAVRGESRGGYWKGETSESFNPMDGFGMEQGREDEGGIRRQEAEKA